MVTRSTRILCWLAIALSALICLAGCDSSGRSEGALPWFVGEYVDPSAADGPVGLSIREDGTFAITRHDRASDEMSDGEQEIASGVWGQLQPDVELHGDGWTCVLSAMEVPVSLLARSDTIAGIVVQVTSGSSPLPTGRRLVRHSEFARFVNPPGGSGSSTGGL